MSKKKSSTGLAQNISPVVSNAVNYMPSYLENLFLTKSQTIISAGYSTTNYTVPNNKVFLMCSIVGINFSGGSTATVTVNEAGNLLFYPMILSAAADQGNQLVFSVPYKVESGQVISIVANNGRLFVQGFLIDKPLI